MTRSNFDDVGDFHRKFDLDNVTHNGAHPREVSDDLVKFRIDFMEEELDEFQTGVLEGDHVQMADALIDLVYVTMGTAQLLGYPWQELWDEVQRANMTKVRAQAATESKRNSTFDVVKPKNWRPPRIRELLTARGWRIW